ncbi:MAG: hypothetical protein COA99_00615 [Moraxellaceae bacterium]|nr:MAG: hypothetical protein COA99_00615 [Moraxellaceae bacterium]
MAEILALVVDDSRMARYVLSKMLKEQGINVDTVQSAEEALGYLCTTIPSMIFMDHTMPGMDGFQAIRAIKNDPKTASVPIMMYTSKEGEVYMNQALALGAVDVLPKQLKPMQLIQVLERQQLLPHQSFNTKHTLTSSKPVDFTAPIITARDVGQDLEEVAKEAERSIENKSFTNEVKQILDEHKEILATQSDEHSQTLLRKLDQKVDAVSDTLAAFVKETRENSGIFHKLSDTTKLFFLAINIVVIIILGTTTTQQSTQIKQLTSNNQILNEALSIQDAKAESTQTTLEGELKSNLYKNQLHLDQWVANLQWALNRKNQFAWDEKPFNRKLAGLIQSTADKLDTAGFKGTISLTSHLGLFCLAVNESGDPELPAELQTLADCNLNDMNEQQAELLGLEKTVQFANFLAAFERNYGSDLQVSLHSKGLSAPAKDYPEKSIETSASTWNSVAEQNQRIVIEFMPLQLE